MYFVFLSLVEVSLKLIWYEIGVVDLWALGRIWELALASIPLQPQLSSPGNAEWNCSPVVS